MGIQGLLPLLKDIQVKTSISTYTGQTVGIDAYCWLHKGAYSCASDIVLKRPTKAYINYVMRRIDMMLGHCITPILVFDGGHLPAKADTEQGRRAKRKQYRERGMAAFKDGNTREAYENFQKCVDISPEMASEVIQECFSMNVQCIVAPYEADAQLAYLMKEGITQLTISEDSDLLLYGCDKVMYKMAIDGEGLVIDLANLPNVRTVQLSSFTEEKFRHMCMLSGCDYLPSIKGMGLMKAFKSLRRFSNVFQCIRSLKCDKAYNVPKDYEENFRKADLVFKYQLVFDIRTKTLVRLSEINELDQFGDVERKFAGPRIDDSRGLQIALGNIDPISGKILANRNNFATGNISQKHQKSTSWDDTPAPNKNTAFHFKEKPPQSSSSSHFPPKNNLTSDKLIEKDLITNQIPVVSPIVEANKSLKRLYQHEEAVPTREEKIRKLYQDDEVEDKAVLEETKNIEAPHNNKLDSAKRHHNVFSHKAHKFKNPFKQVNNKPNMKVVSRFFDNRVVEAKENTVLQVETPEEINSSVHDGSAAKTAKLDGSFLDYLDNTNLRGYEVKVLKLSPEKPKQKQIEKVCSKKKRNVFSLFKKENSDTLCLESSSSKNESPPQNIDFNVTIPVDDYANKEIVKKEKNNILSHFKCKTDASPEENLTDENIGVAIDKEKNNISEGLLSEVNNIQIVDVEDSGTKLNTSRNEPVKSPSLCNKRKSLKLSLSRNRTRESLNSPSCKAGISNFQKQCQNYKYNDSFKTHSSCSKNTSVNISKSSHENELIAIDDPSPSCVEEDLLLNVQEGEEKEVTAIDNDIIVNEEREPVNTKLDIEDDFLLPSVNDEHHTLVELSEEPLPSHLIKGEVSKMTHNKKEEAGIPKIVDVIYLDDEEPLPLHVKCNQVNSNQIKSKPLFSKAPQKQSKPSGLQRKRKSFDKSSDDKMKQMTFEQFAYKKKAAERDGGIICL